MVEKAQEFLYFHNRAIARKKKADPSCVVRLGRKNEKGEIDPFKSGFHIVVPTGRIDKPAPLHPHYAKFHEVPKEERIQLAGRLMSPNLDDSYSLGYLAFRGPKGEPGGRPWRGGSKEERYVHINPPGGRPWCRGNGKERQVWMKGGVDGKEDGYVVFDGTTQDERGRRIPGCEGRSCQFFKDHCGPNLTIHFAFDWDVTEFKNAGMPPGSVRFSSKSGSITDSWEALIKEAEIRALSLGMEIKSWLFFPFVMTFGQKMSTKGPYSDVSFALGDFLGWIQYQKERLELLDLPPGVTVKELTTDLVLSDEDGTTPGVFEDYDATTDLEPKPAVKPKPTEGS